MAARGACAAAAGRAQCHAFTKSFFVYRARRREVALKPFATIAVAIFTVIALVHLHRLFDGWEIIIAGFHVPVSWSAPGVVIAAGLAFLLWREVQPGVEER
jgi:hypothetical protein